MSDAYHDSRFTPDARRDVLWQALWTHYFSRRIARDFTVLDLGCGYGNFINSVSAKRRIALDVWPGFAAFLAPGVEPVKSSVTDLSAIEDGSIDFVLASNLFEHISQSELATVLAQLRRKLSSRGSLTIIQPNYRYASTRYFDDYTHVTIWSHVSLGDFLTANGFVIDVVEPRFLPLTIKSRMPVSAALIGLYLSLPFRPLARQMLLTARAT
ncbi:MAG: class I SAM-dependent methyltransferase [Gemmatimonadaceae bacterium]|nr:class I SAM-dependent methyltransferase [Gemmatimonadaceae bacterium]